MPCLQYPKVLSSQLITCLLNLVCSLMSGKSCRFFVIPKKGDVRWLDNLRPIPILSILGKVIEKHVKIQLVEYFDDNNLFCESQFGFRSNMSIHDAAFLLTDELFKARNNHLYTCTAYLHLSKAFNSVNHSILIKKCNSMVSQVPVLNGFKITSTTDFNLPP